MTPQFRQWPCGPCRARCQRPTVDALAPVYAGGALFDAPRRAPHPAAVIVVPISDPAIAPLFGLPAGHAAHLAAAPRRPATVTAAPAGLFAEPPAVPSLPLFA